MRQKKCKSFSSDFKAKAVLEAIHGMKTLSHSFASCYMPNYDRLHTFSYRQSEYRIQPAPQRHHLDTRFCDESCADVHQLPAGHNEGRAGKHWALVNTSIVDIPHSVWRYRDDNSGGEVHCAL